MVTGAVGGLATVTPAAGFIGPMGAIALGALGGALCYAAVGLIRQRLKIDDSLDVFAVHGVGGMLGSLLFPFFVLPALGGPGYEDGSLANSLVAQAIGVVVVVLWTALMTWLFCFVWSFVAPLRVGEEAEHDGLDLSAHGERGWDLDG